MLTPEKRIEFDAHGFVRLRGVFTKAEALAMEERLWGALERKHGIQAVDRATWQLPAASKLQPLRTHPIFAPMGGSKLMAALDELIGAGQWKVPSHWGQFLISFPVNGSSRSRAVWHTDFPWSLPPDRVVGALVIGFIGEVRAGHGGTLVLAGSPKLVTRFLERKPHLRTAQIKVTRRALLQCDPWLRSLDTSWTTEDWTMQLPTGEHIIDGVRVQVTELTGEPGDVIVGHPWLLHTPSPNRGDKPRFMRVQRVQSSAS